ncbi:DUF2752 domain-containing protein [Kribbella monticola]|uniref:DUF2752 domain-containing protein n=1 Tax=Kribbella monticola TaxID=2185285 RepID=UPI001E3D205D|nr:DUF2752 domain-containing protein [Kribbella monticola]
MYPAHPMRPDAQPEPGALPTGPEPLDRRVLGLAATLAGGAVLAGVNSLSNGRIGLPCPFHAITGLNCPFCGTTRMAAAFLQGDPGRAWSYNPPMFVVLPVVAALVGYMLLTWTLERLTRFRLPRPRFGARLQRVVPLAFLAAMALYGVLRNLF